MEGAYAELMQPEAPPADVKKDKGFVDLLKDMKYILVGIALIIIIIAVIIIYKLMNKKPPSEEYDEEAPKFKPRKKIEQEQAQAQVRTKKSNARKMRESVPHGGDEKEVTQAPGFNPPGHPDHGMTQGQRQQKHAKPPPTADPSITGERPEASRYTEMEAEAKAASSHRGQVAKPAPGAGTYGIQPKRVSFKGSGGDSEEFTPPPAAPKANGPAKDQAVNAAFFADEDDDHDEDDD